MSNRRDMEPTLDFYELRRRHEEYKNSQRQARGETDEPVEDEQPVAAEPEAVTEADIPAAEPAVDAVAEDIGGEIAGEAARLNVEDDVDAAPEDGEPLADDAFEDEVLDDGDFDAANAEDAGQDNPNPFDPFIHAFKGIRGKLSKRFRRGGDAGDEDEDELYEDEAPYEDEDFEGEPQADGAEPASPAVEPVIDELPETAQPADVEDIFEGAPQRPADEALETDGDIDPDGDAPDEGDEDFDDEDDEDEDDSPRKPSGFKKFLRLFVVPIDEDEAEGDDDEDYDEDDWDGEDAGPEDDPEGGAFEGPADVSGDIEGGPEMSDLNNVNSELTNELAAALETSGMSRRERRELALRQAAEKAAREAAEQAEAAASQAEAEVADAAEAAEQQVEEAAQQVAQTVEAAQQKAEQALEADAIEDVASGIVNIDTVKDDYDAILDEPTREFKPVSKLDLDELAEDKKSDDGDDEDDEEEEEDEKPRRGLFGRRRKSRDEDEDEDDEDEDDDEDDEDDEEDRKRSRRRRRQRYDEDDEDEYDEYDDYDDEDDDDYDDDYDDYDDEDGASFGHVLLGILKGFLTAVMLLLFVVVVLNVLNVFGVLSLENFARRLPDKMVSVFLPSEGMKQRLNVEANANPAPVVEQPVIEQPAEQPVVEQPVVEQPVVEQPAEQPAVEQPVVEQPVAEQPAAEQPAPEQPAEQQETVSVG